MEYDRIWNFSIDLRLNNILFGSASIETMQILPEKIVSFSCSQPGYSTVTADEMFVTQPDSWKKISD